MPDTVDESYFSKSEMKGSADVHINSSKRRHSESSSNNECESNLSTDTEDRLVIDCSDSDSNFKTPIKSHGKKMSLRSPQNNNFAEDTRVTRSKARLMEKMSYINQSLGHKPVQFVANKDHDIDKNLCEDTCKTSDGNDLKKSLRLSGCFDTGQNTLSSEVASKMYEDTVRPTDEHIESCSSNMDARNKHFSADKSCCDQKVTDIGAEAQEDEIKIAGSNASTPGFNMSYRLWKLSKEDGHLDDRKEGFLKGDCTNHEIKVLVRCKVDGHKVNV
jgi:hypothetical protein